MKQLLTIFSLCIGITSFAQQATNSTTYPKTIAYFSVVHPLVSIDKNETVYNFSDGTYTVGFPFGVNVITSSTRGFSFEVVPFIKSANGTSKTSNVLFHPGYIFRKKNGFTITTRAAFETCGRYGGTFVLSKVFAKSKTNSFYLATPFPIRFGNDKPASIGVAFVVGVIL